MNKAFTRETDDDDDDGAETSPALPQGTRNYITPGGYARIKDELDQLLRPRLVEIGRSCVHPDYRNGATIALLWSGLARYMLENQYGYLIGCASISMADGGHAAASMFARLGEHMSPLEYRVFPRCPLPLEALRNDLPAELPPLIKGYLRAGAYICGEPAWDPDFNTADLPILMPVTRIDDRYAKHFMGKQD